MKYEYLILGLKYAILQKVTKEIYKAYTIGIIILYKNCAQNQHYILNPLHLDLRLIHYVDYNKKWSWQDSLEVIHAKLYFLQLNRIWQQPVVQLQRIIFNSLSEADFWFVIIGKKIMKALFSTTLLCIYISKCFPIHIIIWLNIRFEWSIWQIPLEAVFSFYIEFTRWYLSK